MVTEAAPELNALLDQLGVLTNRLVAMSDNLADIALTLSDLQARVERLELVKPKGSSHLQNCPKCHRQIRTSNGVCGMCGWRP